MLSLTTYSRHVYPERNHMEMKDFMENLKYDNSVASISGL